MTLSSTHSIADLPTVASPLFAALPGTPLGKLLLAILVLAVVVLVGRVVLAVAWRVLLVAAVVVGVLYLLSVVSLPL